MRKQSEAAFDGATLALPELSATATEFVHQHPEEARVAVTAALEAVAAHFDSARNESRVPDALRTFVVEASGEDDELIGAEEAARRLVVSRATVYNWIESRRFAWLAPHASGHTDPGRANPGSWRTGRWDRQSTGDSSGAARCMALPERGVSLFRYSTASDRCAQGWQGR